MLSFSQAGEDRIIKCVFDYLKIDKPFYIDIGAYHPTHFSNTMLFYKNGGRGINIEPNPLQIEHFYMLREEDINLNIGIGENEGMMTFYDMDVNTLSTFDKNVVKELVTTYNHSIVKSFEIPVKSFNWLLETYVQQKPVDLLSIDVEGMDYEIVSSISLNSFRPRVVCLETVSYSTGFNGTKNSRLIELIIEKGYRLFADTYINSIFIDERILPA